MASIEAGEPPLWPGQKTGSRRGGRSLCRVGGSTRGGHSTGKTRVGGGWGSTAVEDIIKPGNRMLGGGWKIRRKKLNGGKLATLWPDTKSHSCPSHLTRGRRKEVWAVLGCTPAATWERGGWLSGGRMGGSIFKLGKTVSSSPPWRRQRLYCAGVGEGGAREWG